ncbi:MAG: helix-turn-helix transcriptional regulator [Ruminococcaceae bacterium]|nr:helix-turn-helix transcriptional regulator [Oscillospiraceae bacterium]
MLIIGQRIRQFRREQGLTQEKLAETLGVTCQAVSKWETGETYPDITLLPTLANLFGVSVDSLLGMDALNAANAPKNTYGTAHTLFREHRYAECAKVLQDALRVHPGDAGYLSELAFTLALTEEPNAVSEAVHLCEQALAANGSEKLRHTARAGLCLLYMKAGESEKAMQLARQLPHVRESREEIMSVLESSDTASLNEYIRLIVLGEL